jgi:hypothetical protein
MSGAWARLALGGLAFVGLGLTTRVALWPLASLSSPRPVALAAVSRPALATAPADSLAAEIARRDPFRVARRPAAVPYHVAAPPPPPAPPAPHVPKPTLSLTGIAWGAANTGGALIEGLPGVQGARAVRVGDVVGSIRVQQIAGDSVVLAGLDTVWVLRVRRVIP